MKKLLCITFVILAFFSAVSFSDPIITIANNYLHLGDLPQETKKVFPITVKNSGTTELWIKNIHTLCGCTQTQIDSGRIEPGQETTITIVFDSGKFLGNVKKYIEIISNDKLVPFYKVFFDVNVYQDFIAEPAECKIDNIVRRLGKTREISLRQKDGKKFNIENAEYNKNIIDVSWKQVPDAEKSVYNIIIHVKPAINNPKLDEQIRFFLASETKRQFTLPVIATIVDNDLFFEPNVARFTAQEKELSVTLKNYSGLPFNLKELNSHNDNYRVAFTRISESAYKLEFRLTNADNNFFDKISVITDVIEEKEKFLGVVY